jgi:hypothetical protein
LGLPFPLQLLHPLHIQNLHSKRVKAFYLIYLADPKRTVTTTTAPREMASTAPNLVPTPLAQTDATFIPGMPRYKAGHHITSDTRQEGLNEIERMLGDYLKGREQRETEKEAAHLRAAGPPPPLTFGT